MTSEMKSFWQSFFSGVGSLFSWLTPPRRPKTPQEINRECRESFERDWQAVGADMRAAMEKFKAARALNIQEAGDGTTETV